MVKINNGQVQNFVTNFYFHCLLGYQWLPITRSMRRKRINLDLTNYPQLLRALDLENKKRPSMFRKRATLVLIALHNYLEQKGYNV